MTVSAYSFAAGLTPCPYTEAFSFSIPKSLLLVKQISCRPQNEVQHLTISDETDAAQNAKSLKKVDATDAASVDKQSAYKGKENCLSNIQEPQLASNELRSAAQMAKDIAFSQKKAADPNGNAHSSQASIRNSGGKMTEAVGNEDISQARVATVEERLPGGTLPAEILPLRESYNGAVSQVEIEPTAKERGWADGVVTDGDATQRLKERIAKLAATEAAVTKLSGSCPSEAKANATEGAALASTAEPCELDIADDEVQPSASLQWQSHHQALKGRFPLLCGTFSL